MKIAVGCGKRNYGVGWVHIDGEPYSHCVSRDILLGAFEPNSADLIYASHLIAYFSRSDFDKVLSSWKRVLKDGGILRIATPDFEALKRIYDRTFELSLVVGPLYGEMQMAGETIYHRTVYDFPTLFKILGAAGFKNIERYDWRQTEHAHIDDHSQAYQLPRGDKENGTLLSLNVQCTK